MFKDCTSATCVIEGAAKEEKTDDPCHFQAQENQNEILLVGSWFSFCFVLLMDESVKDELKSDLKLLWSGRISPGSGQWMMGISGAGRRENGTMRIWRFAFHIFFSNSLTCVIQNWLTQKLDNLISRSVLLCYNQSKSFKLLTKIWTWE